MASPLESGGNRKQLGQEFPGVASEDSSKKSVQAPQPPPSGQEHLKAHHPPSIHHSTPAPVSPLSSIGLGARASGRDRQQQEGLGMSEGRLPQSQLAAPRHGRPTTGQQAKESGDVPEEGKLQPTSLPGRQSPSPKPKRSRSGNGSKLEVINTTLLKACMDGNEDNIESIVNMSLPELNVVCVGEAGLSPLHYAVKNRLKRGLAAMVQHTTFTLSATDKDGQTPLHYAAKDGDKELLQLLNHSSYEASSGGDSGLEDFTPQNIRDKDGNTALHLCLEGGHFDIVKLLVAVFNCSLLVKNNKGLRPVHLAADQGNIDIVKYLMRHEHPPEEDTLSHYNTASESEPGETSVKSRKEWSSSELEVTSGSGDKSLVSAEQEGGHSWGSSEMLVGSGVTPTTSALYSFLQLRGDKMNKTRMEVRSAAVLTGPQECSLMELKEQVRVLRERLETAQKKMSHLKTEIQQHHIMEALRQAHLHPSEDEEADHCKYSSYRHKDLVEELLYVKSFVQKFEVVAIESKATAQRFSAELEAEKASNQALRDSSDVSRSLWEKRIGDLSTTVKRHEDEIAELEAKIEALKKKKGKEEEEEEERDELAGPLQGMLLSSSANPSRSSLKEYLQRKGDKMERTRKEVRSAAVLTGPRERSLMELKEQVRVLRERLETAQKKLSHLETEIQQHHIREALRQALHPSEDEEADRRKYSSYRHEDLVEELLYINSFVQKFEVVAIESKAEAKKLSVELEAEKTTNQKLRDDSVVWCSLWEKRIRDLSTTIKRREDTIAELKTKIEENGKET